MTVSLCETKSGKDSRIRFGEFLLNKGEVNEYGLEHALHYQRAEHVALGALAVQGEYLSERQLCDVKDCQRERGGLFGEIAVELGLINEDGVNELLEMQEKKHTRIGEVLVMFGAIRRKDMESRLQDFHASA